MLVQCFCVFSLNNGFNYGIMFPLKHHTDIHIITLYHFCHLVTSIRVSFILIPKDNNFSFIVKRK